MYLPQTNQTDFRISVAAIPTFHLYKKTPFLHSPFALNHAYPCRHNPNLFCHENQRFRENQPKTLVYIPNLAHRHRYKLVLEEIRLRKHVFCENTLAG
jgi:hypothetical protein